MKTNLLLDSEVMFFAKPLAFVTTFIGELINRMKEFNHKSAKKLYNSLLTPNPDKPEFLIMNYEF